MPTLWHRIKARRASAGMIAPRCRSRSFARRPDGEADVCIFRKQARQIDRAAERSISEPLAKPIPELKPVEPQRRRDERLEKLVALLRVKAAPSPASWPQPDQRAAFRVPYGKADRAKETTKTKIANMRKGRGRADPAEGPELQGTRRPDRRPHRWRAAHPWTVPANLRASRHLAPIHFVTGKASTGAPLNGFQRTRPSLAARSRPPAVP